MCEEINVEEEVFPTAEAHTFLGWTLSFLWRYDDAVARCFSAIAIDSAFGNPYNDVGGYELAKQALKALIARLN